MFVSFVVVCSLFGAVASLPRLYRDRYVHFEHESNFTLPSKSNVQERLIQQPVNHFNPQGSPSFSQRYFIDETYWGKSANSPVFMCVGGEGPPLQKDVLYSSVHCNDMVELAPKHGALLVALEHRYYGVSMPNVGDYSTENLLYLSTEQALEDIAAFITTINAQYDLQSSNRWVTWGGSYPGMMAAMARLRFPHLIFATVSSSSPLQAAIDFPGYNNVVAESMANGLVGGSAECLAIIKQGHQQIGDLLQTASGRSELENTFNVCVPGSLEDPLNQEQFAGDGVVMLPVQGNDPSCTSDLCNIEKICSYLISDKAKPSTSSDLPVEVLRLASLSAQQSPSCTSVSYAGMLKAFANPTNPGRSWLYQTCTEWGFYQTCEVGTDCPYTQGLHTLSVDLDICKAAFGLSEDQVRKNIENGNRRYGGAVNFQASRILFPNGQVDPWKAGGVLSSPSGSLEEPTMMVAGASHHFWTHPSLPTDSDAVNEARKVIWSQVTEWLGSN